MRILALLGLTVLVGCAQLATPNAPLPTTVAGRRCVRECRSVHDKCLVDATGTTDVGVWDYVGRRQRELSDCNDVLSRCYATCPG